MFLPAAYDTCTGSAYSDAVLSSANYIGVFSSRSRFLPASASGSGGRTCIGRRNNVPSSSSGSIRSRSSRQTRLAGTRAFRCASGRFAPNLCSGRSRSPHLRVEWNPSQLRSFAQQPHLMVGTRRACIRRAGGKSHQHLLCVLGVRSY